MTEPVVFHVEIGPEIGGGHLSRCRVIAAALRTRGIDSLFSLSDGAYVGAAAPFRVMAADGNTCGGGVVVVDGYGFTSARLAAIRAEARAVVLIDDLGDRPFPADLLVCPNIYGSDLDFAAYHAGRVLAGARFALVDPTFAAIAVPPPNGDILLTFGLSRFAEALRPLAPSIARAFAPLTVRAVLPGARRDADGAGLERVAFIAPAPLAALMTGAGLVVCGLGVTYTEAVTARRRVAGVRLVGNQDLAFADLRRRGLPVSHAPTLSEVLPAIEAALRCPPTTWQVGLPSLDGGGPARVADAIALVAAQA